MPTTNQTTTTQTTDSQANANNSETIVNNSSGTSSIATREYTSKKELLKSLPAYVRLFKTVLDTSQESQKELEKLLSENNHLANASNTEGDPAILLAIQSKNPEALKKLLEYGANPNKADAEGNTALFLAIYQEDTTSVDILLSNDKTDVNLLHREVKITPLSHAINVDNDKIINALLSHKDIDVNQVGIFVPKVGYSTPLNQALENNNQRVVKKLIEAGADIYVRAYSKDKQGGVHYQDCNALDKIILDNNLNSVFDYLFKAKPEVIDYLKPETNSNIFHILSAIKPGSNLNTALENIDNQTISRLMHQYNSDGATPLHHSVDNLNIEFINTLFEHSKEYDITFEMLNNDGLTLFDTLIAKSIWSKKLSLVKAQFGNFTKEDEKYLESISQAAKQFVESHPEVMSTQNPSRSHNTPLHTAAFMDAFSPEVFEYMLKTAYERDPDLINKANDKGITPIQIFIHDGDYYSSSMFLKYKPKLTYLDEEGVVRPLLAETGREQDIGDLKEGNTLLQTVVEDSKTSGLVPHILSVAKSNGDLEPVLDNGKDMVMLLSKYRETPFKELPKFIKEKLEEKDITLEEYIKSHGEKYNLKLPSHHAAILGQHQNLREMLKYGGEKVANSQTAEGSNLLDKLADGLSKSDNSDKDSLKEFSVDLFYIVTSAVDKEALLNSYDNSFKDLKQYLEFSKDELKTLSEASRINLDKENEPLYKRLNYEHASEFCKNFHTLKCAYNSLDKIRDLELRSWDAILKYAYEKDNGEFKSSLQHLRNLLTFDEESDSSVADIDEEMFLDEESNSGAAYIYEQTQGEQGNSEDESNQPDYVLPGHSEVARARESEEQASLLGHDEESNSGVAYGYEQIQDEQGNSKDESNQPDYVLSGHSEVGRARESEEQAPLLGNDANQPDGE